MGVLVRLQLGNEEPFFVFKSSTFGRKTVYTGTEKAEKPNMDSNAPCR